MGIIDKNAKTEMLNQKLFMLRQRMVNQSSRGSLLTGITKRAFSSTPVVNNTPAYIMGALGLAGLSYLTYTTSEMGGGQKMTMARGETRLSSHVQDRLGKTFGYFGYGILTTSAFVY